MLGMLGPAPSGAFLAKYQGAMTARYFKRPEDTEHLVAGLREAGFPE
jgi:hypothetical protein